MTLLITYSWHSVVYFIMDCNNAKKTSRSFLVFKFGLVVNSDDLQDKAPILHFLQKTCDFVLLVVIVFFL